MHLFYYYFCIHLYNGYEKSTHPVRTVGFQDVRIEMKINRVI